MGRMLLTAALAIALSLAVGAPAMACGAGDDTASNSERQSSEGRETRTEAQQAEDDNEEDQEEDSSGGASSEERKEESEGSTRLSGLLAGQGKESESEDTESSSESASSSQPASSGSDNIGSGLLSISQSGIGSEAALAFLPAPADGDSFGLEFRDIETILTDGRVPDVIRTDTVDSYSDLERSCIFLDEIDSATLYGGVQVVSGDFNLGDLRGVLKNNGFTQETYRDYELWTGESLFLRYGAIAFPSDSSQVILGWDEQVKDVLKALNRGSNLLSANKSDAKRLLDSIGRGRLLWVSATTSRGTYARITSASDEAYAVDIAVVAMAESAQEAEAIAESTKAALEAAHIEVLSIESKTNETLAVVEATVDEKYLAWWQSGSFRPAFYSEGQLVEAGVTMVPAAPGSAAPAAPRAQVSPTPTPAPMCPSRSQTSVPAPRTEVSASSVSVSDEPLDLVLEYAAEVEVYDIKAILTDEDMPSVFRDNFAGYYNQRIMSLYLDEGDSIIAADEVDKVVRWQSRERYESFLIVSGGFDRKRLKDKLGEQTYEQSDYRGFELWSFPPGTRRTARTVTFLGTDHILIGHQTHLENLEDVLGKLNRGTGLLTQNDNSTIRRVLDKAGQGLTLVAGPNCLAPGCSAYAIATSTSSEDYAMNVRYVGLFGSGQEAEAGVAAMESYVNRTYDVVRYNSSVDGKFAVVDVVVDEESVLSR